MAVVDHDALHRAWHERDVVRLVSLMAPDVTLHSPMLDTPFTGRDAAAVLYSVLFSTFSRLEFVDDFVPASERFFRWQGEMRGTTIEGADLVRYGVEGTIVEIRVFIRPLTGIAAFASATGPRLAAQRGRTRSVVAAVTARPLGPLFRLVDRIAPRLLPMGSPGD